MKVNLAMWSEPPPSRCDQPGCACAFPPSWQLSSFVSTLARQLPDATQVNDSLTVSTRHWTVQDGKEVAIKEVRLKNVKEVRG